MAHGIENGKKTRHSAGKMGAYVTDVTDPLAVDVRICSV
jgi:hypothetical protein